MQIRWAIVSPHTPFTTKQRNKREGQTRDTFIFSVIFVVDGMVQRRMHGNLSSHHLFVHQPPHKKTMTFCQPGFVNLLLRFFNQSSFSHFVIVFLRMLWYLSFGVFDTHFSFVISNCLLGTTNLLELKNLKIL